MTSSSYPLQNVSQRNSFSGATSPMPRLRSAAEAGPSTPPGSRPLSRSNSGGADGYHQGLGFNGLNGAKGKKKRLSDASRQDLDGREGESAALLGGEDVYDGVLDQGLAREDGTGGDRRPGERLVKGRDKSRTIPLHSPCTSLSSQSHGEAAD